MTRRARWLAAIAGVAIAIVAPTLWRERSASPKPASPAAPSAPLVAASSAAAPKAAARATHAVPPASKHALPPSTVPFKDAVPQLREYAEAGDADAAVELSWRLRVCTDLALARAESWERSMRDDIAHEPSDDRFTPDQHTARIANLQRQIDDSEQQRNACAALSPEERAGWLDAVDRAAQAGSTAAMLGYARLATADYYTTEDVRNDLDRAIERRDKSRAYLDEALARGDAQALRDIANAYSDSGHPTIYPFDPEKAYAYAYAGTLAGIARGNDLDRTMEETARVMDGRQLAAAEAEGRRIYEMCCAKR